MSNIDFDSLSPLECPLLIQPSNSDCIGDLIEKLTYNLAIMERALLEQVKPAGLVMWSAGPVENKPKGFILADGSWYSPEVFPRLFDSIQYRYGKREDGCFRLPDLRAVAIRGNDLGRKCFSDISDWDGFDTAGNQVSGDYVGSQNTYTFLEESVDGDKEKEMLLTPLISTGEICL